MNTEKVILKLNQIEKEHAHFFNKAKRNITDYVINGFFNGDSFFINTDLPFEITRKIQKVFDEAYYETHDLIC